MQKHIKDTDKASRSPLSIPVMREYTSEIKENTENQKKIVKLLIGLSTNTPGTLLN